MSYAPYSLPKSSLVSASINNILCTSAYPWPVKIRANSFALRPVFLPLKPEYSSVLEFIVDDEPIYIALQDNYWCFLHEAFAGVSDAQKLSLPRELQQALLENLAEPIINDLSKILEVNIKLKDSYINEASQESVFDFDKLQQSHERVCFALSPQAEEVSVISLNNDFLADVWLPKNYNVGGLIAKLSQVLSKNTQNDWHSCEDIPLYVCFEKGYVNLSKQNLLALECGDVLLPDHLYAQNKNQDSGENIRIVLRSTTQTVNIKYIFASGNINKNKVKVLEAWHMSEHEQALDNIEIIGDEVLNSEQNPEGEQVLAEGAMQSTKDVLQNLDVMVSFELERRSMSLQDIKAIGEGYTFALECDKNSPVTLRVNGKNIGKGRLVDMDGLMGVEVIKLG